MGVKVAPAGCFQYSSSQPIIPHSHPPFSSSSKRRCRLDTASSSSSSSSSSLVSFHLPSPGKLHRTRSYDRLPTPRRAHTIRRSCSASLDPSSYSDDDFHRQIQDLVLQFRPSGDDSDRPACSFPLPAPPEWHGRAGEETIIERKANSVDIPLSLRLIKRKIKWEEGLAEAGDSAYCSIKKAFSSMVFIVRELHSYSLQMREALFSTEDLQAILARVHKELHASFVWLFQRVFSHTPTLMVSVMILLANFTVYSMGTSISAAAAPLAPPLVEVEKSCTSGQEVKFEPSSLKRLSVSSQSGGKSTFVGGDGGRGGGARSVSSGTGGDGGSFGPQELGTVVPNGGASTAGESAEVAEEEERLWASVVDEARRMEASVRDESLDAETVRRFVSPVTAWIEPDDPAGCFRTALVYQDELAQDPNNPLLLANYAQFLYLVAHDYDRAEEYFKRAINGEPKDAEAYSKYASFLWRAKKDLWAAEETFLEAISAEPTNSYYAANYAHFLWNTGGDDTCFPLSSPDTPQEA